jgi:hypothetical protein
MGSLPGAGVAWQQRLVEVIDRISEKRQDRISIPLRAHPQATVGMLQAVDGAQERIVSRAQLRRCWGQTRVGKKSGFGAVGGVEERLGHGVRPTNGGRTTYRTKRTNDE